MKLPDLNYQAWWFWLSALQLMWTTAIGVYVWLVTRKKAREKMIAAINEAIAQRATRAEVAAELAAAKADIAERCKSRKLQIAKLEESTQKIGVDIGHLPSRGDITRLSDRLDAMNGSISELNGRLHGINRAVDLINEFLINQGAKG